jgi:hypothetical protein
MAESGRNSAFYNCCAIDLPSSIPWHGVDQFLASENTRQVSSNLLGAIRQGQFCHSSSWADVPRRIRHWPQVK